MRYTESELKKAIKFACEAQKAADYQSAGILLIVDESSLYHNSKILLDELSSDETVADEIDIDEIFE